MDSALLALRLSPFFVSGSYVDTFDYNKSVTTVANTSAATHTLPIPLPGFALDRMRIYISGPSSGLQAHGAGLLLIGGASRSYGMIELEKPFPRDVTLTLTSAQAANTRIYLLADGAMTLTASVSDISQKDYSDDWRQKTAITLTAVGDAQSFFQGFPPSDAEWQIRVLDPSGAPVATETVSALDGVFSFAFYPLAFGDYSFNLLLSSCGIRFEAAAVGAVSEIPPPPPPEPSYDYSLWIALGVGALLILAALLISRRARRRRRLITTPILDSLSVPVISDAEWAYHFGSFGGKLDIYGLLVDGGKIELPPISFGLSQLAGHKSVSLATVLEQAGIPFHYPAAEFIRLFPGPNHSLAIKNNSDAVVYRGGQAFFKGQTTTLAYTQKARFVFEDDVSEYEIYYHSTAELAASGRGSNVQLTMYN